VSFPPRLSLTITNNCNLRCRMCGQWSETGYVRASALTRPAMRLSDWKRVVDEGAAHGLRWLLVRGGEPFLYPGIMELLFYVREKGISLSIDTNGTLLKHFAADLVRLNDTVLTISVDGPEEIHDAVRGVAGCFRRIEESLAALRDAEQAAGRVIPRTICFTLSRYNLRGLGEMPGVARRLRIPKLHFMPYYYVPPAAGKQYEEELAALGCRAFSWRGFANEHSGIDFAEFLRQLQLYRAALGGDVTEAPFLTLSEDGYRTWFADVTTPIGPAECWNLDGLLDIQPDGEANFCIDFPDYSIGNVRGSTIEQLWNGERANRFREARRKHPFAVCHRCGARHCSYERPSEPRA
jgi:MoaA/NifB/PqqE/SkfB family radical SAM enzyme